MPNVWTTEQVTSMAPDGSSLAAGRKQAGAKKWQSLGRSEHLLWGEIKGSGSKPYQVCIELAGPAFKCTCPSHKFPCKHALGLAFVYAEETSALGEGEPPDWARGWMESRAERAQKKAERAAKAAEPETPEVAAKKAAAQQKRAVSRRDKVQGGIEELERWIGDLIRQGLAAHASEPYGFWDQIASRMVDAQAPGLARMVRRLGELRYGTGEWQSRLLDQISRLHLLLSAYRRIDTLDPDLQAEVQALIGFPQDKDALLAKEPGVSDTWFVLGEWTGQEEDLRVRRTWARGTTTGINALLVDFAVHNQVFPAIPPVGCFWQAELVFYPGALPSRAFVKHDGGRMDGISMAIDFFGSFSAAHEVYGEALARNPWIERYPLAINGVTPENVDGRFFLRDAQNYWLPIAASFDSPWETLAMSGGRPLLIFGEWDGYEFLPLTIFPAVENAQPQLAAA